MKKTQNKFSIEIQKNAFDAKDDGTVVFKNGLTITDGTEQYNGTRYDIKTMNIAEFPGKLTADHVDKIENLLGLVHGVRKVANNRVSIDSITFAINESAFARFAYNMLRAGYLTDFSIETYGPYPDDDGVYYNSNLVGLSAVVTGNNKSAKVNQIVKNSIKESKELNLDTSVIENDLVCYDNNKSDTSQSNNKDSNYKGEHDMFVTVKNSRSFDVTIKYTNAAGDEVEKTLQAGETIDVKEDQADAIKNMISDAQAPQADISEVVSKAVNSAVASLNEKLEKLEKQALNEKAQEPAFKKSSSKTSNSTSELESSHWTMRTADQLVAARQWLKGGSESARNTLMTINEFHKEKLAESGALPEIVANSIDTIDFGNFIISPELFSEIQGYRSNYKPLLGKVTFSETLSNKFGWLTRSGDIDMTSVTYLTDAADGNLKPISEYTANYAEKTMEELAAVTPVMNATNRFLAADLMGDIAMGYRNDYDKKLAQLIIARLQQSTDTSGNQVAYTTTSGTTALQSWVNMFSTVSEPVPNGVFIMSYKTKAQLIKDAMSAGWDAMMTQQAFASGETGAILGAPSVYVPNDLLPTLNSAETKTFVVDGVNVTINQAVFYCDLAKFKGRVSGGLQYDLSTEAAYEDGGTVKSAFQRNELVVRGSFFRNGAWLDDDYAASLFGAAAS